MRNLAKLPFVYLICLACTPLLGQGTFQNLNFENATIVLDPASPYYPYAVISATAVPGWTAYVGATPQSDLLYNTLPLSSGAVSIYDTPSVLQGRYSLFLEGSTSGDQASVSQTGLVPTTAQSIRFYGTGNYDLTLGGQEIPLVVVGQTTKYTIFGADISAFANQTAELRIGGVGFLDNIVFSSQAIPEPASAALILCGAAVLWIRFRRKQ